MFMRRRLDELLVFLGGAFGSFIGSYSYFEFGTVTALIIGFSLPLAALFVHIFKGNKESSHVNATS
ncbi:hypothetical protein ABES25_07470 [Bacillus gobiensis]|uniref:hypothetical protein n=1 Tax=Bacillus gobiensis TaxID=1441095 RepID=UPI003D20B57B